MKLSWDSKILQSFSPFKSLISRKKALFSGGSSRNLELIILRAALLKATRTEFLWRKTRSGEKTTVKNQMRSVCLWGHLTMLTISLLGPCSWDHIESISKELCKRMKNLGKYLLLGPNRSKKKQLKPKEIKVSHNLQWFKGTTGQEKDAFCDTIKIWINFTCLMRKNRSIIGDKYQTVKIFCSLHP